jgi:hypothetical protein
LTLPTRDLGLALVNPVSGFKTMIITTFILTLSVEINNIIITLVIKLGLAWRVNLGHRLVQI